MGYSLQANRKTREGSSHPDRNAQFEYINQQVRRVAKAAAAGGVGGHEKEGIGGRFQECRPGMAVPRASPKKFAFTTFKDKNLGKAIPYGVYDVTNNQGWVSVGIDHDTAHFACATIRRWWNDMGSEAFPAAQELLITADGGGSNSYRSRLWKVALQQLADQIELKLRVCHFPPGTSKWNKIEHRLFSFITQNWRGKPLLSRQTIVNLIASTTTTTGLIVRAALDTDHYETGIKVSDEELAKVRLTPADFMENGTTPSLRILSM